MSAMDDKTEAAFALFGLIDEETQAQFDKERAETEAVVAALESKYSSRGLKFTQPFAGAVPVQAFGHIDGMRFYFRYRSGRAVLRVGPFNQKLEDAHWQVSENDRKARLARVTPEDDDPFNMFLGDETPRVNESDADYYPHEIRKVSAVEYGDEFGGWLSSEEMFTVFSSILDQGFTEIPESEWISDYDRAALAGTVDEYRERVYGIKR